MASSIIFEGASRVARLNRREQVYSIIYKIDSVPVINTAVGGNTIEDIRQRLLVKRNNGRLDNSILVIQVGVNDFFHYRTAEQVVPRYC